MASVQIGENGLIERRSKDEDPEVLSDAQTIEQIRKQVESYKTNSTEVDVTRKDTQELIDKSFLYGELASGILGSTIFAANTWLGRSIYPFLPLGKAKYFSALLPAVFSVTSYDSARAWFLAKLESGSFDIADNLIGVKNVVGAQPFSKITRKLTGIKRNMASRMASFGSNLVELGIEYNSKHLDEEGDE